MLSCLCFLFLIGESSVLLLYLLVHLPLQRADLLIILVRFGNEDIVIIRRTRGCQWLWIAADNTTHDVETECIDDANQNALTEKLFVIRDQNLLAGNHMTEHTFTYPFV